MSRLAVRPVSFNAAKRWISEQHRHQPKITGWLFGVELLDNGVRVGVAACGRPARMLQDGATCEIVRVATDGTPNVCSYAYGALRRAAAALGYTRVITYARPDESGASVRGAGFVFAGLSRGGEWGRPTRPRKAAADPGPKLRWVWYATQPLCTCPPRATGPLAWPGPHAAGCPWAWHNTSEREARAAIAEVAL